MAQHTRSRAVMWTIIGCTLTVGGLLYGLSRSRAFRHAVEPMWVTLSQPTRAGRGHSLQNLLSVSLAVSERDASELLHCIRSWTEYGKDDIDALASMFGMVPFRRPLTDRLEELASDDSARANAGNELELLDKVFESMGGPLKQAIEATDKGPVVSPASSKLIVEWYRQH